MLACMGWLHYLLANRGESLAILGQHFYLVFVSTAIAILVGVPLGIWTSQTARASGWVLGGAAVLQTIPSLALFGFLVPLPWIGGIGSTSAVVALVLYSLLPIIRGTHTGIRSVEPAVLEAAVAMGMTPSQRLRQIQLPLAVPVIFAGIRVATVVAVGTATIAAAVGAGGLGTYIFRGLATVDNNLILAGAIPAALMALIADWGLGVLEHRLDRVRR